MLYTNQKSALSALNNLASVDRRYPRKLSCSYGFDYNKPIRIMCFAGKFTPLSLNKRIAELIPHDLDRFLVTVTTFDPVEGIHSWRGEPSTFTVVDGKFVAGHYNHHIDGPSADWFVTIGSIHERRKKDTCYTCIVAQEKDLLRRSTLLADPSSYKRYTYLYGSFYEKSTGFCVHCHANERNLDESGYYVYLAREELRRRADVLRAERRKSDYSSIDCTPLINDAKVRLRAAAASLKEVADAYLGRLADGDFTTDDALQESFSDATVVFSRYGGVIRAARLLARAYVNDDGKLYPDINALNRDLREVYDFCKYTEQLLGKAEDTRSAD